MFRPLLRGAAAPRAFASIPRAATRRTLSTAPPHEKSRSWKNSAVRWTLAGALVYYYNTSPVFAEEADYLARNAVSEVYHESEQFETISSAAEQRKAISQSQRSVAASGAGAGAAPAQPAPTADSPGALEEEASQQGAFNEETGEINWDCPCLGGMAYGPCGEQFRAAFSCFVYSKEEPKGVECIEKFKDMQNCFREHPDIYGAELDDEDQAQVEANEAEYAANPAAQPAAYPEKPSESKAQGESHQRAVDAAENMKKQSPVSETEEQVPKSWHSEVLHTEK